MSLFGLIAFLPCSSCGGNKEKSHSKNALLGRWSDQVKLIGGQGIANLRIDINEDSTFTMNVEASERAHVLNPYPTLDRIRFQGNWSFKNNGEIHLDGKIKEFARLITTGQAASQGFLRDDEAKDKETHYTPLPFERPIILRKSENGSLFLSSIQFQGNKPESQSSDPTTRMIVAISFKKKTDAEKY